MRDDFIVRGTVADLDPELKRLLAAEDQRQQETIILIPSESLACDAVNEALTSSFGNVYAEGYPREDSRHQSEAAIMDFDAELAIYRRNSDPRYYKGVEYADILEALTRRRAAELFATNGIKPDQLYVNVQPLSGAPANNAVYTALLQPGDTIMGLNLNDGGHLSHGSAVHRSGVVYKGAPYFVDPETELLDYDAIEAQALEVRPQIIVAGFSAYPRVIDWARFRVIADRVGALLLADIAHISGLVASGVHPSPIGIADVVTTTTHKSLTGPRGAMIMTHRADIGRKIDRALFPGEQGGPHLNTMASLALALKLANSDPFRALQERIVANAGRLAEQLEKHGLRTVSGGSDNHLLLIDCKSVTHDGVYLSGDMAARILDVVGIVTNRNTIPGDPSAFRASGVRIGTVWISQLGYGAAEIDKLAEAIAVTLNGCRPFFYAAPGGKRRRRAKVDPAAMRRARLLVAELTGRQAPVADGQVGYLAARAAAQPAGDTLLLRGDRLTIFLDQVLAGDMSDLTVGGMMTVRLIGYDLDAYATLRLDAPDEAVLRFADAYTAQAAAEWLRDLSDGYAQVGADMYVKAVGPVAVTVQAAPVDLAAPAGEGPAARPKPFFVGPMPAVDQAPLPEFVWAEPEDAALKETSLHAVHVEMGGRMVPFGGWDMPVWYSSVSDEHQAVRTTAGLFDVSHMGVFEVSGPHAAAFLEAVTTNEISRLDLHRSHYTYLLAADGSVIDDLLVYRRGPQQYMMVVNAANNDKDWAWLNAVNDGAVCIDPARPGLRLSSPARLRDLRDPQWGAECRVDLALQGPAAQQILLALVADDALAGRIKKLPWAGLTEGVVAGLDVIISRTGYTGERVAYELFVHPEKAPELWAALLAAGTPLGLLACGLAARDSTRTEAGLPLYGHELAGSLGLNPAEAGFANYVKLWKPFFIGRSAFVEHQPRGQVVRFRMNEKGVRRPETGDPIVDWRGKVIGYVTSCALDQEGFLLGQAFVPDELTQPGAELQIYQLGGGQRALRQPKSLDLGARLPLPDKATVLTRFPAPAKKK